jgi:hypothetical protein
MAVLGRLLALLVVAVAAVAPRGDDVPDRHNRETALELVGVATSYPVRSSLSVVASTVVVIGPRPPVGRHPGLRRR